MSKQLDADKMSMKVDDDIEDRDVKCIECDVCKDNSNAQTTQLPIASKRCSECKQNLCEQCLRVHLRYKLLMNHQIEDIPSQIEKIATEPSQSNADNNAEEISYEDLDSAKLNVSSDCLSTTHAQHQNNVTDVMTQIRKERDRLKEYEAEMSSLVQKLRKGQEDIETRADNIVESINKKHSECVTRLKRYKKSLQEQLDSQKKENVTKLAEAISYLKKIKDLKKNLDEIINKGHIDAKDESFKFLLLHIHFQQPIPSLANVSFNESSFWTSPENILGRLEGPANISKTPMESTQMYKTFLKNSYSLAKNAREIHWKLTIPNEIEMKNLRDLKTLHGVQNELKLSREDRKWGELQAKHLEIVRLLTRTTSESSSEKLESHLTELQLNIERLWNIIEFQIHYKNSEKGLIPQGFQNHGNTCYFNAVLQCLLQAVVLPFELTVNIYGLENVLKENKEIYHFSKAFMELASNYNEPGQRQGSPWTLYSKFKKSTQRFNDQEQHDSHDLLIHFLDKLRVEERNVWKLPSTGLEIQKISTAVDRIFGGQFITVYTCHNCKEPYSIREPFLDISIPLCVLTPDEQKSEESRSKPTTPSRFDKLKATCIPVIFRATVEQAEIAILDAVSKQIPLDDVRDGMQSQPICETDQSSSSAIDTARKEESSPKDVIKDILQPIGVEVLAEPETKKLWSRFTTSNPTVSQCLKYFTRAEVINDEYLCRNCQESESADLRMTSATKRTLISSPPAVLVLHLKRFEQKSTGFVKRDEMISYEELLDLGPFCSSSALRIDPEEENVWYSLYAVVIHRGFFLSRGHYVAYVKQRDSSAQLEDQLREKFLQKNFGDQEKVPNDDDLAALEKREAIGKRVKVKRPIPIPGQWFYVSDDSVRCCDTKEALNQKAFLLFYERIPCCYHKTTSV